MPSLGPYELGAFLGSIFAWFTLLSPLWLVAWLVVRRRRMPACPHCGKRIKRQATVCRFCRRSVAAP